MGKRVRTLRRRLDAAVVRAKPALDRSLPLVLLGLGFLIVFQFVFAVNAQVQQWLTYANYLVIAFFAVRLLVDYRLSEPGGPFLREHWMDVVMVIPVFSVLQEARALRLIEELPVLTAIREEAAAATVLRNTNAAAKVTRIFKILRRSI